MENEIESQVQEIRHDIRNIVSKVLSSELPDSMVNEISFVLDQIERKLRRISEKIVNERVVRLEESYRHELEVINR